MRARLAWLGLGLGLVLGLLYGWLIRPAEFAGAAPDSLRPDFRDEYLALIGAAYSSTRDLERARSRLALFPDLGPADLDAAIQRTAAQRGLDASVRGLATLSAAQRMPTPSRRPPTSVAAPALTATPRRTPTAAAPFPLTVSPFPTAAPTLTPSPPATSAPAFVLLSREPVCDPQVALLLQVSIRSAQGTPFAGVEVRVSWPGGGDHFFTGMAPDFDPGYGDFAMSPGVSYQADLEGLSEPVRGISAPVCTRSDGTTFPGSVRLVFQGH